MAAPAKFVPDVTIIGLSFPKTIIRALSKPQAAPVSRPTRTTRTMFTPWPEQGHDHPGREGSARWGCSRSRMPPLIVTSASATVTTPRTAMVKVMDKSVWRERKSDRVDGGRRDEGHPRAQDDQAAVPSDSRRSAPDACQVRANSPLRPAWPAPAGEGCPWTSSLQGLFAHRPIDHSR